MTGMDQLLLNTVLSGAETLILFQMFRAFLRRSPRPDGYYYLGLFSYFVFQLITYAGRWPLFSAWIYYLLFTFFLAYFFFADALQIKILVTYLFVTLHYSCKLACSTLFMALKHADLPFVPSDLIQSPLSQIAACIIFILFTWLFIYFRSMRRHNKYHLYSAITYLAPAGILFIVINQFYLRTVNLTAPFYLSESGILMCASFTLFYLIDKTEMIDEVSERSLMASKLLERQKDYYKNVEKSQHEVAAMRHDLKNHLHCIASFIEMEQYQDALQYIEEIYATSRHLSSTVNIGNSLISILLNNARERSTQSGIRMTVNAMVPPDLPIDNVDLCIILGNLLDNAYEACCRMEESDGDRFINVEILFKKSFLFIKVSNSFNGQYLIKENRYESVKKGQHFCGIGLSNVKTTVEKYDGEMKVTPVERVFTVTVMLKLRSGV